MSQTSWTFLTNYAHIILCLSDAPESTIRDLSVRVGITERAVQSILNDLVESGYLNRERIGRHNCYQVVEDCPLRHPVEEHCTLADLVKMVHGRKGRARKVRSQT